MKTLLLIIFMIPGLCFADQFALTTVNVEMPNTWNYASQDTRIQYNFGDKNYLFVSAEQMHICPYYCGVTYNIAGLGYGVNKHYDKVSLFAQFGIYLVKNNVGFTKTNENIQYYMMNKFNGGNWKDFTGYQVDNGNGIGATIGIQVPFSDSYGMQFSYRHLQFWSNYIAYLADGYWHDPATLKYDGYQFGIYWKF